MGFGPQDQPGPNIPVGDPGPASLRQYGTSQQTLATNNVPVMGAVTGADAASVQIGQSNGAQGSILIYHPSGSGSVALNFPSTPPTLFIAGNPSVFGTISQATVGDVVTVTWSGGNGGLNRSEPYIISFQWATAK